MLSEWHLPPDYVNEHFTEELMILLFEKREERLSELQPKKGKKAPQAAKSGYETMSLARLTRRIEAGRVGGKRAYEEN